eukprot:106963-Lingulodinium_polyedra.AAC.1
MPGVSARGPSRQRASLSASGPGALARAGLSLAVLATLSEHSAGVGRPVAGSIDSGSAGLGVGGVLERCPS